jgi:hypothetical protein
MNHSDSSLSELSVAMTPNTKFAVDAKLSSPGVRLFPTCLDRDFVLDVSSPEIKELGFSIIDKQKMRRHARSLAAIPVSAAAVLSTIPENAHAAVGAPILAQLARGASAPPEAYNVAMVEQFAAIQSNRAMLQQRMSSTASNLTKQQKSANDYCGIIPANILQEGVDPNVVRQLLEKMHTRPAEAVHPGGRLHKRLSSGQAATKDVLVAAKRVRSCEETGEAKAAGNWSDSDSDSD